MILTLAQIKDGTGFRRDARFEEVTDYNGWTNRETWAVALWLNNDQGLQEAVFEALTALTDDDGESLVVKVAWTGSQARAAGEAIKDYIEGLFDFESRYGDLMPTNSELLNMRDDIGSLWRVNWDDLGASFLLSASGS